MNCREINIQIENNISLRIFSPFGNNSGEIRTLSHHEGIVITYCESNSNTEIEVNTESIIPVLLTENRDYYMEIQFSSPHYVDNSNIFRIITKNEELTDYSIQFNSKNYVGILNLGVFGVFTPLIEVKSKKIDYEYDYNLLLKKISLLGIDLTTRAKSYFETSISISDNICEDENILSSKLSYLKSIILSGELESLYFVFLRKPLKRIEQETETVLAWETGSLDVNNYTEQLSKTPIRGKNGKIYPLELNSECFEDSIDNIENRFLKFLIEYIINYIEETLEYLNRRKGFNILVADLQECLARCERIYGAPVFRSISRLTYFPHKSNVLHQRYPYRDLYSLYWFLFQDMNIADAIIEKSLKAPQKDLPQLYEYWCFLSLIDLINSRFQQTDMVEQGLSVYNIENLCYIIDPSSACIEYVVEDEKIMKVYYNKEYQTGNYIYQGRSYSHPLNPDISLELFIKSELVAIIHFDAKYKLDRMQEFKNEDLDKMHTYKDGILGTIGAYILYPGKKTERFLQEELNAISIHTYFPSVGAFEHSPADQSENNSPENKILELIESFIHIDHSVGCGNTFTSQPRNIDYLKRLLN